MATDIKQFTTLLKTLSKPMTLVAGFLGLSVILMGLSLVYVAIKQADLQRHISLAGEQLLLSQRIATFSLGASAGNEKDFNSLIEARTRFDNIIKTLHAGDPKDNITKLSKEVLPSLDKVEKNWNIYRSNVSVIVSGKEPISEVKELYSVIDNFIPQLLTFSDEVVGVLIKKKADQRQVYLASRQMMLTQRIKNNLNQVLAGGEDAPVAADRFGRDAALFGRVLEGLLKGSKKLKIKKVTDKETISKLREVAMLMSAVSQNIARILKLSPEIFKVKDAASKVQGDSDAVLNALQILQRNINKQGADLDLIQLFGVGLGVVSVVLILIGGMLQISIARRREEEALEGNRRNQRAILRLLDEMANLADGDLTVHTTVTEEITGAIADSVNFAIDALRTLVTTINRTAGEVASSTDRTLHTASILSDASNHQTREITSASEAINNMATSMEKVAKDATESADVALKSVEIAQKGAKVVRGTIESMESIREQIQETSKRIKRLGESSQEIGDIVGLITEIADQTNILALNAAIQASTAGDAGRGFAVVADEVQRLAERASNATKQIEGLVNTIQADTNEAVNSMEISTSGVVTGAKMAEDAGVALKEIEDVSSQLSTLIQGISDSSKAQSTAATDVSKTMTVIQGITVQTSAGTSDTSKSLNALSELSNELRRSVSGFKLPSDEAENVETVVLDA